MTKTSLYIQEKDNTSTHTQTLEDTYLHLLTK